VLEHEIDELVAVNEPQVLACAAEILSILRVGAERDEQAQLGSAWRERAGELRHVRQGHVLTRSPFVSGVAADGRRVGLGADGTLVLLNRVVERDAETGVARITAPDQVTLDKLIARERHKAEATGNNGKPASQPPDLTNRSSPSR
jgi:hypothetical protein